MKLVIGCCYGFLLANGQYAEFLFIVGNAKGQVEVESPPGSGTVTDLHTLLGVGYTVYWEVKPHRSADAEPGAVAYPAP